MVLDLGRAAARRSVAAPAARGLPGSEVPGGCGLPAVPACAGGAEADPYRPEEDDVDTTKNWTVRIDITEHDGRTRAVAHLHTGDTERLTGVGFARLDPADPDVPEIGDEIAVARALSDLAHRLLDTAGGDLEEVIHTPVRLAM